MIVESRFTGCAELGQCIGHNPFRRGLAAPEIIDAITNRGSYEKAISVKKTPVDWDTSPLLSCSLLNYLKQRFSASCRPNHCGAPHQYGVLLDPAMRDMGWFDRGLLASLIAQLEAGRPITAVKLWHLVQLKSFVACHADAAASHDLILVA